MALAQWILYDQCHQTYIEPGVTDIFFVLFTGKRIASPTGNLTFSVRSKVAEYAIAREFLDACRESGYTTHWIEATSYAEGIETFVQKTGIRNIVSMRSSEVYLERKIEAYHVPEVTISLFANRQFLMGPAEFRETFEKPPVMETFYRYMRKSRNILMTADGKPVGGKWNYDHENRSYDAHHTPTWNWKPKDTAYIDMAKQRYQCENIDFLLPVSRNDALGLLQYFLKYHYENFGRLEDAMYQEDARVHHSLLSGAINFGLLTPLEVIEAALAHPVPVPISSQEGFIRQILGWREYMRQFYLYYYDTLYTENFLNHHVPIPNAWWNYTGTLNETSDTITSMNCVDSVVRRVQKDNYSHHIERLMIIGNFALLRGYHPHEVNRWFWELYTDAFEWVVSPNVLGMSQYSDGGRLATKPYISGGNYIDNMSNYCKNCSYSIKDKTCPMTHLYWDFVDRNQAIFQKGRTPYVLSTLTKLDIEKIRNAKAVFLKNHPHA